MAEETRALVERVFREESGQAVATLIRLLGDFDLAEEAVQEAFLVAVERWPISGVPDRPGAWIVTTARNKAIDRLAASAGWPSAAPPWPCSRRPAARTTTCIPSPTTGCG